MKASKRYQLEITIDSGSRQELIYAIHQIADQIHSCPDRYDRRKVNDAILEYKLETYGDIQDYREEQINGVWCQIFKSKM